MNEREKPEQPRTCAYCADASGAPLTKEHLWPTSIHRRRVEADEDPRWSMWIAKIDKDLKTEYTVRDVCEACNNGFLSQLDAYGCELFDRYFTRVVPKGETIELEHDYHKLKRWLLKLSYNSARVNASLDRFVFPPLLPYMRGESEKAGRSVHLYVALTFPAFPNSDVPEDMRRDLFVPTGNRLGHMFFTTPEAKRKLLRTVFLRAFSFFLAFFEPGASQEEHSDFSEEFLRSRPSVRRLRPSRPTEVLIAGVNAWETFVGARSRFVTDGDLPET